MINPTRQNNQIPPLQPNPDPIIPLTPNIKEPRTIKNIPNLLVLMQMLMEEALHLLFVDVAHFLGRHGDLVPVLVGALFGERFYLGGGGDVLVDYSEVGQVGWVDCAPGVVGEALVALLWISHVRV